MMVMVIVIVIVIVIVMVVLCSAGARAPLFASSALPVELVPSGTHAVPRAHGEDTPTGYPAAWYPHGDRGGFFNKGLQVCCCPCDCWLFNKGVIVGSSTRAYRCVAVRVGCFLVVVVFLFPHALWLLCVTATDTVVQCLVRGRVG